MITVFHKPIGLFITAMKSKLYSSRYFAISISFGFSIRFGKGLEK